MKTTKKQFEYDNNFVFENTYLFKNYQPQTTVSEFNTEEIVLARKLAEFDGNVFLYLVIPVLNDKNEVEYEEALDIVSKKFLEEGVSVNSVLQDMKALPKNQGFNLLFYSQAHEIAIVASDEKSLNASTLSFAHFTHTEVNELLTNTTIPYLKHITPKMIARMCIDSSILFQDFALMNQLVEWDQDLSEQYSPILNTLESDNADELFVTAELLAEMKNMAPLVFVEHYKNEIITLKETLDTEEMHAAVELYNELHPNEPLQVTEETTTDEFLASLTAAQMKEYWITLTEHYEKLLNGYNETKMEDPNLLITRERDLANTGMFIYSTLQKMQSDYNIISPEQEPIYEKIETVEALENENPAPEEELDEEEGYVKTFVS